MRMNEPKGKRQKENTAPPDAPRFKRDPFEAVPVVADQVESREDVRSRVEVRVEFPSKPGLQEFLARNLRFRKIRRHTLDERGSFFWKQIDGNTSLAEIEKRQRRAFSLERRESRDAIVLFTKALMNRGLIYLKVAEGALPQDELTEQEGND